MHRGCAYTDKKDFELLFIDDGSTDDSASICDEFAQKDERIYGHWDERCIYRPSVTVVGNEYWLYYSAYGAHPYTSNHIGLVKFHNWNEMLRCFL